MSGSRAPSLVEFLRTEAHRLDASLEEVPAATEEVDAATHTASIRVPLELDGAIWSAVVTEVEEDHVHLVVDREAVGRMENRIDAAIRYQPDNCDMQRACGRIASFGPMSHDHVALDFLPESETA